MRIITGTAKGCKLKTPAGMSTRPTSDRMKESLFSILGEDVLENRVLDIFAGTGGLGLEALSRGAASAVFIDKATADIIAFNAQHTNLADKCRILAGDVFVHLQRLEQQGQHGVERGDDRAARQGLGVLHVFLPFRGAADANKKTAYGRCEDA